MTAETLTANRAKAAVAAFGHGIAGNLKCAYGQYSIAVAALEDGDIFEMCWLPPRSLVVGGILYIDDLDTGTEAVDIDLGWADNGAASTYVAADGTSYSNDGATADPDGFVNGGVLTGDAITDLLAAGSNIRIFPMVGGFRFFAEKTKVQLEVNVAQATPQAGVASVVVFYVLI